MTDGPRRHRIPISESDLHGVYCSVRQLRLRVRVNERCVFLLVRVSLVSGVCQQSSTSILSCEYNCVWRFS